MRDIAPQIGDTAILGVSPDKPAKQARFDTKHGLGFPLLADEDHAVAEAYGVWAQKSMYGKKYMGILRSAYLIDQDGRIAEAWYKVKPADTATNLLAALETRKRTGPRWVGPGPFCGVRLSSAGGRRGRPRRPGRRCR